MVQLFELQQQTTFECKSTQHCTHSDTVQRNTFKKSTELLPPHPPLLFVRSKVIEIHQFHTHQALQVTFLTSKQDLLSHKLPSNATLHGRPRVLDPIASRKCKSKVWTKQHEANQAAPTVIFNQTLKRTRSSQGT